MENTHHDLLMIGSAHLDPAWLWKWQEGYAEIKATFQSALDRMEETEDFIFTCAGACYYAWVEENEPVMFEKIRQRVEEGRWKIVGGMWIQPDMNLPSQESIARQLMISQGYFLQKFGVKALTGYNVDTFGHGAFTPMLLKKAGIHQYVWMRPQIHENDRIPEGPMRWQSPDGSEIMAYRIPHEYLRKADISGKIRDVEKMGERLHAPMMCFYGVGNHGGGPTIENIKEIHRFMADDPLGQRVKMDSPDGYFPLLEKEKLPIWQGELQHHASGCYSSHGKGKYLHRRTENDLMRMEKMGVLAGALMGHRMKKPFTDQAWQNLCFNQFHDLLGGCAIREALNDMEEGLAESRAIAARETNAAIQKISWHVDTWQGNPLRVRSKEENYLWHANHQGTPVVVFNPHGFEATGTVRIRQGLGAVRSDEGAWQAVQKIRASHVDGPNNRWDSIFRATVPPLGYRLYWVYRDECQETMGNSLRASETCLENDLIRAEFEKDTGRLCQIMDKQTGFSALGGPARVRLMNIEKADTWAHNIFSFDEEAGEMQPISVRLTETGPVRASLEVISACGGNRIRQVYHLYNDGKQLEVETALDLRAKQRMVKLCFPVSGKTGATISEVAGGWINRKANGLEEPCQRWLYQDGLLLVNDGQYSYSALPQELRLTIGHSSQYADHYGQNDRDPEDEIMDLERLRFTYCLRPCGRGLEAETPHRQAALLNQPLLHVLETYHEGELPGCYRGISISDENLELLTIKEAENKSGLILHLQENGGKERNAEIALHLTGQKAEIHFAPFEFKTLLFPADGSAVRELLFTEEEIKE